MTTPPIRMCLACRKRSPKRDLWRFSWDSGELRLDRSQRDPGRGVYIHPEKDCLTLASSKKSLWDYGFRGRKINNLLNIRSTLMGMIESEATQQEVFAG